MGSTKPPHTVVTKVHCSLKKPNISIHLQLKKNTNLILDIGKEYIIEHCNEVDVNHSVLRRKVSKVDILGWRPNYPVHL